MKSLYLHDDVQQMSDAAQLFKQLNWRARYTSNKMFLYGWEHCWKVCMYGVYMSQVHIFCILSRLHDYEYIFLSDTDLFDLAACNNTYKCLHVNSLDTCRHIILYSWTIAKKQVKHIRLILGYIDFYLHIHNHLQSWNTLHT